MPPTSAAEGENPEKLLIIPNQSGIDAPKPERDVVIRHNKCPFSPALGFCTKQNYEEFHRHKLPSDGTKDESVAGFGGSDLYADPDRTQPLYFWQLYSIIGEQPILEVVADFYARIYADVDNDWFRQSFLRSSPDESEIHITAQVQFWVDAMGGGKRYYGGNRRVRFHHEFNGEDVMNAKGATLWMKHMTAALLQYDFPSKFPEDPRILPCIVWFLKTRMKSRGS